MRLILPTFLLGACRDKDNLDVSDTAEPATEPSTESPAAGGQLGCLGIFLDPFCWKWHFDPAAASSADAVPGG